MTLCSECTIIAKLAYGNDRVKESGNRTRTQCQRCRKGRYCGEVEILPKKDEIARGEQI